MDYFRWCISPRNLDGSLYIGKYGRIAQSYEIGVSVLCFCQFNSLVSVQTDNTVTVLPSLNTPIANVSGATQTLLTNLGGTIAPNDCIINTLRSLRNNLVTAGKSPWFDISDPN